MPDAVFPSPGGKNRFADVVLANLDWAEVFE